MLGGLNSTPDNHAVYGGEMSVLERQRALFERMNQSQQLYFPLAHQNLAQFNSLIEGHVPGFDQFMNFPVKIDQRRVEDSPRLNMFVTGQNCHEGSNLTNNSMEFARQSFSTVSNSSITTASPIQANEKHVKTAVAPGQNVLSNKKRKAEFYEAEAQSEITVKSERGTSGNNWNESSKLSEVQKPDYIHVRARRGQATDSHSLAERARREKISKKMKYLQDLVPGCNKVTGKAGMLEEIINYVQSLQKQVEFLSMKLATLNPRLDMNTDNLFMKDCHPYMASYPTQLEAANHRRENCFMSFPEALIDSSHGFNF